MDFKDTKLTIHKTIKICGKVILTGEHSVLRGGLAVACPLYNKFLELVVLPPEQDKDYTGFQPIDQRILQRALEVCGRSVSSLKERILVKNSLLGGGLGNSGAICVALGHLMVSQDWLSPSDLFDYCRTLENFFHGESSGLDIAVILKQKPISYQREEGAKDLLVNWSPCLFVSFCGKKSVTYQNIKTVQNQRKNKADQKMSYASRLAIKALQDSTNGLPLLIEAIQIAYTCFDQWSLISNALATHIDQCEKDGALASKPTGSGYAGHALSVFASAPSKSIYSPVIL